MNKELLVKHVKDYYKKSQTDKVKFEADWQHRVDRLTYCQRRNRFDRKRRAKMTQNAGYTTASHPTAGTFAGGVT